MAIPNNTPTVWGLHAGKHGDALSLFKQHNVVAIGWPKVPDLSKLKQDRDAYKAAVLAAYPAKPMAVPVNAGQLFRFVNEVQKGQLVVFPSPVDRQIHIGEITGPYRYDPGPEPNYPHHRPVKWLTSLPRTQFSQGALHELGSAMSLFQVRNYAQEYQAGLSGIQPAPAKSDEDETVALVAEEIEQNTRDFILKCLATELKGHPFAKFVAHVLETMGYHTRVAPPGPDGGVDIIAHRDELGFEPPIIKVQVKSTQGTVGQPEVTQLRGTLAPHEFGLLVTLGSFAPKMKQLGLGHSQLRLIDGQEFVDLVLQQYEALDPGYKGLIPLKRVYIPQPVVDQSGD